jgi:hypothetical protein
MYWTRCCSLFLLFIYGSHAQSLSNKAETIDSKTGEQLLVQYIEKEGYALIEGDIIIGTADDLQKNALGTRSGSRWPDGQIPYIINDNMPNKNRTYLHQAIDEIEDKTNIRFIYINATNKDQYKDYIEYVPSNNICSSYVGKKGGRQVISLAPSCDKGITLHEVAHAVGLHHEQNRYDRDSYVRIAWENILDDDKENFLINQNALILTPYDYGSIMHFGTKEFSKNGKSTVIPLKPGTKIGQRNNLSQRDIYGIYSMYTDDE